MSESNQLPDDLIEAKEAARIAKAHLCAIHRWVQNGKLRGWQRCGRLFVSRADLMGLFRPVVSMPEKKAARVAAREHRAVVGERLDAEGL